MHQVLVIDDDRTIQVVLRKVLSDQGYEVAVASDGLEGINQAQQLHPALIICDWLMPLMDGLDVCRRIKADPELSSAFFILLTSRDAIEDRVYGLDNGADDILTKPFELNELKARVRAGLRLYHASQDLKAQKHLLESEFKEAAEYVRSLLPKPLSGSVTIDSRFIPSQHLGGDCFDYYWLDPDYLAIYLLDVSGHGLGAALPSISVLNMLRSQSMDGVNFYQPSHVLTALNEAFQMDSQNDKYFTIWYGVYNQAKRQLVYSSAGHPPAILLNHTTKQGLQSTQLRTTGMPIGMLPDTRFVDQRCDIDPTSVLYIFSDGVYEVFRENNEIWGFDAFIALLVDEQATIAQFGLDYILNYVKTLNTKVILDDDLSLLRISFCADSSE
ncbi:PP2C family protein-serine/threonine phosphatase [Stenomitos frigidus]|uniref:Regulator n=1 Tax=Stenomitos frigidus ULC18 TaxID=2107698 RepID=A0A2T1E3D2_9CYAN|nr:SpoIIE family protein phosphatase [Stenomitos frigidus]PSB27221.1 regulator [Stenomitos frigidus ULC18]